MINSVNDSEFAFLNMVKALLEQIVKTIVNTPGQVRIESKTNEKQLLTIKVDDKDLGKIIGKNGQTIKSIRGLVNAINLGSYDVAIDIST